MIYWSVFIHSIYNLEINLKVFKSIKEIFTFQFSNFKGTWCLLSISGSHLPGGQTIHQLAPGHSRRNV